MPRHVNVGVDIGRGDHRVELRLGVDDPRALLEMGAKSIPT